MKNLIQFLCWSIGLPMLLLDTELARAQFDLSAVSAYSQNFDHLGTINQSVNGDGSLQSISNDLKGWYMLEQGSAGDLMINAGSGSNSIGDTYNYGIMNDVDRSIGMLRSSALISSVGFYFRNNTGNTITTITIQCWGEQWRLGTADRLDKLNFQFSLNAGSLNTGMWVDIPGLDFIAPVTNASPGPLNGNADVNRKHITAMIAGLHIANGNTCFIRWTDHDASGNEDGLSIDDFSILAGIQPNSSAFFRSANSGSWGDISTWESSTDHLNWIPSSTIPTYDADTIRILNGHHIIFEAFAKIDELVIEPGGSVELKQGIMEIQDGSGVDMLLSTNAILILSSPGNPPLINDPNVTVRMDSAAIVRIAASGLTSDQASGVLSANYFFGNASVLEYTLLTPFGSNGLTYFSNADPYTIPIFRITRDISLPVGATGSTNIHGIFEANGKISFSGAGNKIFRNGIRAAENITGNGSGKFIINGNNAEISGPGIITTPLAGMEIGAGSMVTVTSPVLINGNLILTGPNSIVTLNDHQLSVSGSVISTLPDSYVRTNAGGALQLNNIGLSPKKFNIGNQRYNPVTIANGGGASYSVRVTEGPPAVAIPASAVNQIWSIQSSIPSPNIDATFQYHANDLGIGLSPTDKLELLVNSGTWSVIPGNTQLSPQPLPGGYFTVSSKPVSIPVSSIISRQYVLGRSGGYVLSTADHPVLRAQTIAKTALLTWNIPQNFVVKWLEIQRAEGFKLFETIIRIDSLGALKFKYIDTLEIFEDYRYRLKLSGNADNLVYSNVVLIIHEFDPSILIFPNPVLNNSVVRLSGILRKTAIQFRIIDGGGQIKFRWSVQASPGENNFALPTDVLDAGVYYLVIDTNEWTHTAKFVKL